MEICLDGGSRYRVRQREQWPAGPGLVVLLRGRLINISYRNIASINSVSGPGRGHRRRTG